MLLSCLLGRAVGGLLLSIGAVSVTESTGPQQGPLERRPQVVAGHEPPLLVVTMSIWTDIVDRVDCRDHFEIATLIPPGGDPHAYEPSMRDRDIMAGAALVVANGADLEAQLDDTLDAVSDDTAV